MTSSSMSSCRPLLFEAALNLHWSELRRDLAPVVALSTVGVGLSARVVALGMHAWLRWPIESALVFGALIAATDPIAVIALLRESGDDRQPAAPDRGREPRQRRRRRRPLHAHSRLGGARSIGLRAVHSRPQARLSSSRAADLLVGFSSVSWRSLVAGTSDDHLVETALTVIAAFGSFLIAEHFHASGVLATVAAGHRDGQSRRPRGPRMVSASRSLPAGAPSCSNSGNLPPFSPTRWCSF